LRFNRPPFVILPCPLCTVDAFLGEVVTERLSKATLADLSAHETVGAVLEVVDLREACDFGLVEGF